MKYIKYLFLILCFISCKETITPPIDKAKFTSILIDIHTMDAFQSAVMRSKYGVSPEMREIERGILAKYEVSKAKFDSCVVYYSDNIHEYASIYEIVLDSLGKRKSKVELIVAENKKRDTLNIWPHRDSIYMQGDTLNSLEFDVPFSKKGIYKLELEVKFSKKDKGINNFITGFATDNKNNRLYFDTVRMVRDTAWHKYTLKKILSDSIYNSIHYSIMKCSNLDSIESRDVKLRRIKLFNPVNEPSNFKNSDFDMLRDIKMQKIDRFRR